LDSFRALHPKPSANSLRLTVLTLIKASRNSARNEIQSTMPSEMGLKGLLSGAILVHKVLEIGSFLIKPYSRLLFKLFVLYLE